MREIKFRAVYKGELLNRVFLPFDIYDELTKPCNHDEEEFAKDVIFEQFTGRRDCRKEELYDGDLLKDSEGNVGVVEWNEDDCSFNVRFNGEYQPIDTTIEEWGLKIGNIHENPELLKG